MLNLDHRIKSCNTIYSELHSCCAYVAGCSRCTYTAHSYGADADADADDDADDNAHDDADGSDGPKSNGSDGTAEPIFRQLEPVRRTVDDVRAELAFLPRPALHAAAQVPVPSQEEEVLQETQEEGQEEEEEEEGQGGGGRGVCLPARTGTGCRSTTV